MKLSKIFLALGLGVASATALATPITNIEEGVAVNKALSDIVATKVANIAEIQKVDFIALQTGNQLGQFLSVNQSGEPINPTLKEFLTIVHNKIEARIRAENKDLKEDKHVEVNIDFRPLDALIKKLTLEEMLAIQQAPLDQNTTNEELAERAEKLNEMYEKHRKLLTDEINKIMDDIEEKTGREITDNVSIMKNVLLKYPENLKAATTKRKEVATTFRKAVELEKAIAAAKPAEASQPQRDFANLMIADNDVKVNVVRNHFRSVKNEADIKQLRSDLNLLRKEHRQAIAQVAAMASVDFGNVKARTIKVGAAVGHYKNQTALAIGAAIAPNNNWMINSKISTISGKDVTFGVGATYEFSY